MLSRLQVLMGLAVFYIVLGVLIGLYGASKDVVSIDGSVLSHGSSFNIITGLTSISTAWNLILFTPLVIGLGYMIISMLPTVNGGS